MANNKRFFKALRFAHWHVELPIAAQLPVEAVWPSGGHVRLAIQWFWVQVLL